MGKKSVFTCRALQGNPGFRKTKNKEASRYLQKKKKTHRFTVSLLMRKKPAPPPAILLDIYIYKGGH